MIEIIRRKLLKLWRIWEWFYSKWYHLQEVPSKGIGLLRISVQPYRGKKFILQDGTEINPGDLTVELHLNNENALMLHQQSSSPIRTGIKFARQLELSWEGLREMVRRGQIPLEVKAFHGVTLLYRGRLEPGTEVHELSRWTRVWLSLYLRWLMVLYHPQGWQRLKTRKEVWVPKAIWISKKGLLSTPGDNPPNKANKD